MNEYVDVDRCPVCSNDGFVVAFRKEKFTGKCCTVCGAVYVSPVSVHVRDIYKDDKTSSPSKYYSLSEVYDRETFSERLSLIEKYISKGKLLDVGCSVGTLLEIASERQWCATGVEPNPVSAEICRNKNLEVIEDFLSEKHLDKYSDYFDAVYLGDVLEHVPNPLQLLETVMKFIKKKGILAVVSPNFGSIIARFFQIKPLEHLVYYNVNSLNNLMEQINVKVELIKKTTRKRKLKALYYSTTFSGRPVFKYILKIFSNPVSDFLINLFVRAFVRDEILVIARKK